MQKLELNEEQSKTVEPRKGFWRRQFQKETTGSQNRFDWLFGVIMPVICFVFDPIVFKGESFEPAVFGTFKPFAYILSFVLVMAMSAWLLWGKKLKGFNAAFAGLFLIGGLISFGIGIVLLPFSLLGLIFIIGILGFTPLFTSIVYLRTALRSYQTVKPFIEKKLLVHSFILSALLSFVLPSVINLKVEQTLDEMQNGDAQTIRASAQRLEYLAPIVNFDFLARSYLLEKNDDPNNEKRAALAEAYQELTGENLETKATRLAD